MELFLTLCMRAPLTGAPMQGKGLRHKLESHPAQPKLILTEPGVSYRLRV